MTAEINHVRLHGQIDHYPADNLNKSLVSSYEEPAPVWESYNTLADDTWPYSRVICDITTTETKLV